MAGSLQLDLVYMGAQRTAAYRFFRVHRGTVRDEDVVHGALLGDRPKRDRPLGTGILAG